MPFKLLEFLHKNSSFFFYSSQKVEHNKKRISQIKPMIQPRNVTLNIHGHEGRKQSSIHDSVGGDVKGSLALWIGGFL